MNRRILIPVLTLAAGVAVRAQTPNPAPAQPPGPHGPPQQEHHQGPGASSDRREHFRKMAEQFRQQHGPGAPGQQAGNPQEREGHIREAMKHLRAAGLGFMAERIEQGIKQHAMGGRGPAGPAAQGQHPSPWQHHMPFGGTPRQFGQPSQLGPVGQGWHGGHGHHRHGHHRHGHHGHGGSPSFGGHHPQFGGQKPLLGPVGHGADALHHHGGHATASAGSDDLGKQVQALARQVAELRNLVSSRIGEHRGAPGAAQPPHGEHHKGGPAGTPPQMRHHGAEHHDQPPGATREAAPQRNPEARGEHRDAPPQRRPEAPAPQGDRPAPGRDGEVNDAASAQLPQPASIE